MDGKRSGEGGGGGHGQEVIRMGYPLSPFPAGCRPLFFWLTLSAKAFLTLLSNTIDEASFSTPSPNTIGCRVGWSRGFRIWSTATESEDSRLAGDGEA